MQAPRGFTLIELLLVIAIIAILSTIVIVSVSQARESAYFARAKVELKNIANAVTLTSLDGFAMPPDVDRDLPSGLEAYLGPGSWPQAPWPGSVYDWDNWNADQLSYPPFEAVQQVSVRFCPIGQPSQCRFPGDSWADDFDQNSAVYYCISGPCRAHRTEPVDHPGYCVNC